MARLFGDLELQYVKEVLDSRWLGGGKREGSMADRLEKAFAKKVGAKFGIARSSAMTALAHAMTVSGAGTAYEVICDPIVTFGAVTAVYFNAVPRFADVKYDTYLMDPESVRANITDKTKALIVTNLWGLCAELDEIRKICDEHDIFMIEDCAHNMGSYWKGKHAGTYGDLGCFSFHQAKHLSTGDGGMMVTDREDLYHEINMGWVLGEVPITALRLNFRMNEVTAAIALGQLQRVDGYIEEYTQSLETLNEAIADCQWLRKRHVSEEAVQPGYIWACTWEGDKHGLDYDRFKQVCQALGVPVRFGFTSVPAYAHEFFKVALAYHYPDCPIRCPFYDSDYRYREGLCPVAEDLIPRLVASGVIEVAPDEVKKRADLLRQAIKITERG